MKNLIQDTLKKIEERRITPEPRWKFLMKKYGLWLAFAAVLVFAALALSAAWDNARNLDWDLHRFMRQNRLAYFFSIFPYFWAFLIALFLAAAFMEIRRTETGYRYGWLKIIAITVGGLLVLGIFMTATGFGGNFHSLLSNNFPAYGRHMMVTKESQWMQPEKGFLAGTIISAADKNMEIEDLNGESWNIQMGEKTLVRPAVNLSLGEMVKIIGRKRSANNFEAAEIRPWAGRGHVKGINRQNKGMMPGGSGNMMRRN